MLRGKIVAVLTPLSLWLVVSACSSSDTKPAGGGSGGAGIAGGGQVGAGGTPGAGTGGATGGAPSATGGITGAGGIATTSCPAARPAEGAACVSGSAACTYDEIQCTCPAGTWSCTEPVDPNCPAAAPVHGSVCTVPDLTECDYIQDECECTGGLWSCDSAADGGVPGDAGPIDPRCPAARPAEDSACTSSNVSCTYDANTCLCPAGTWQCNEPVDPGCPAQAPTNGSPCSGTADCDFLDLECECLADVWECKTND